MKCYWMVQNASAFTIYELFVENQQVEGVKLTTPTWLGLINFAVQMNVKFKYVKIICMFQRYHKCACLFLSYFVFFLCFTIEDELFFLLISFKSHMLVVYKYY